MFRRGLWRDPDFLKLWSGQTISQIGSRITRDGLPYAAVLTLGASPLQMGILTGAGGAAVLVFGLFAGAWADRLRRRPILIAADLGRAAVRPGSPVPLSQVVSALVDDVSASDDVRRAVAALHAADDGDDDARFVVDGVEDHELAWYAAQALACTAE